MLLVFADGTRLPNISKEDIAKKLNPTNLEFIKQHENFDIVKVNGHIVGRLFTAEKDYENYLARKYVNLIKI